MRIYRRIGLFALCVGVMACVAVASYVTYMKTVGYDDLARFEERKEESRAVDGKDETAITHRTKLVVEQYNRKEGTIVELDENMPVEYVGLDRQGLEEYLEEYEKSPSIADLEIGFEGYQIMSFSNRQVVLRKTFLPPNVSYKYYLTSENGCVIVYYIDKKTVFEYTNISVDSLPMEIQRQLQRGKYVTDIESLYDFLENYSS